MDVSANGGQLHMETTGTSNAMGDLISAETTLATSWQASQSAILGCESRLGKGPLGASFAESYNDGADGVKADMGVLPGAISAQADVGRTCVTEYIDADLRGKQGLSDGLRLPTASA